MAEYKRKSLLSSLTPTELLVLAHDWHFWAREEQLSPQGDWRIWLILAGRGWGKTRTGAEWVISCACANPSARIALVGETLADARSVMVEGESGILAIAPLWMRPKFEPSKRLLTFPNGAMATLYSADEPEQLRGPQFSHAWGDELGKWNYDASFENLQLALRLGDHPQLLLTTTPRPTPLLKKLLAQQGVVITRGTTFDNQANLPKVFLEEIIAAFDGTRLGRQELYAEMLEEVTGALWTRQMIEQARVPKMPVMQRIVVGVDPAVSYSATSAETGIVVAGLGQDGAYYVLADVSGKMTVDTWAKRVINTYHQWQASRVVAEVNNGGALVEQMLRGHAADLSYKAVRASYGKLARAEPIAALYEQGKVHHVGMFPLLEDQLCQFDGTGTVSPDRLDALVWALTELMQVPKGRGSYRIRVL